MTTSRRARAIAATSSGPGCTVRRTRAGLADAAAELIAHELATVGSTTAPPGGSVACEVIWVAVQGPVNRTSGDGRYPCLDYEMERRPQAIHLDQPAEQILGSIRRLLTRISAWCGTLVAPDTMLGITNPEMARRPQDVRRARVVIPCG